MNARNAAYETLMRCEKEKQFSNIAISGMIENSNFEPKERALYTQLVYGTIERQITIDYIISSHSDKPIKRLDKPVLCLLRLGVYQIKYCDKIPDSAAVDETIKLAARYASRAKGFINALLRSVCGSQVKYPPKKNLIKYLSVYYSVSEWICSMLTEQYGADTAEAILEKYNKQTYICLFANTLKTTRDELTKEIDCSQLCNISRYGIKLTQNIPFSELDCLSDGKCFIQDEASQIACMALDAHENMRVIDVCSCPGGKSFAAAISMNNRGQIFSFDIHESKLPLIEKGAHSLGIDIIHVAQNDATKPKKLLYDTADRVICDVPCSGLGVLAKKPDLRYKDKESADALPELQYEILCASSKYPKKDGIVVYSTCTLNKNENERVVERFLTEHKEFTPCDFDFGKNCKSENGMLTVLPHIHDADGFFIAKLKKTS